MGRAGDIWGTYLLQKTFPECVVYHRASVWQERNQQDWIANLEQEVFGYRHTSTFIRGGCDLSLPIVPAETRRFLAAYRRQF